MRTGRQQCPRDGDRDRRAQNQGWPEISAHHLLKPAAGRQLRDALRTVPQGAEDAGHRVEMLNINDYNIGYFDKPEYVRGEEDNTDDDAMAIIDKMKNADVLVLASPVYFYSMTAQMKALIDRTYNHEKDLGEKEFYYIVTSTDREPEALEGTIEGFRGFARCLYKSVERGIVHGNGARERGAILNHPAMQEAYELGKGV